ncbi:hypothetical protein GCM10007036_37820 [Alsobacter metallidurans]|uniref:Uncharacterized protein n=1 Tax=Alsobacter metallidurans TaxID=340221 RepID=A0A917IB73_9HYPH|nr:hypothetical protein GCM10007036_37820 [Alsobacter metallidurans]
MVRTASIVRPIRSASFFAITKTDKGGLAAVMAVGSAMSDDLEQGLAWRDRGGAAAAPQPGLMHLGSVYVKECFICATGGLMKSFQLHGIYTLKLSFD